MLVCTTPIDRADDHRQRGDDRQHRDPLRLQRLQRRQEHAREGGERRGLDAGRHERGDDGRRAFVGIGRPHVERHRRDLEREADREQPDAENRQRRRRRGALRRQRDADLLEPGRAGDRVEERDAVEEERARERAEQEILERRLGAGDAGAAEPGQHVDRERQDLERDEDDQQVGRRRPSSSCRRWRTASARSTRRPAAAPAPPRRSRTASSARR